MAYICDVCWKEGDKVLAPFIIERTDVQAHLATCAKHLALELEEQLQMAEYTTVRRGEIRSNYPAPPRPPA